MKILKYVAVIALAISGQSMLADRVPSAKAIQAMIQTAKTTTDCVKLESFLNDLEGDLDYTNRMNQAIAEAFVVVDARLKTVRESHARKLQEEYDNTKSECKRARARKAFVNGRKKHKVEEYPDVDVQ